MKMKSAAGIVCYVKDVDESAQFYENLGFQLKKGSNLQASRETGPGVSENSFFVTQTATS
jgi:hypothetical protein